ncbi:ABC1 family domain-containing protein [Ditylenchus destructor]|nr:ABC1 family domain-containing protein [Ditylenchus destructor]
MLKKKGSGPPFKELGYWCRAFAELARSQMGYELRHSNDNLRKTALRAAVCGGDVRSAGQLPRNDANESLPTDVLGRVQVVAAGINTFTQLIAHGVYPGYGGYEVTTPTTPTGTNPNGIGIVPNETTRMTAAGPSSIPPPATSVGAKRKVMDDGVSAEEEAFLIKAAKEVGVVFPEKVTPVQQVQSPQIEPLVQEAYRPVLPKNYEINFDTEMNKAMSSSKERAIPTSRLARVANFGRLAFGLGGGAMAEVTRRTFGITQDKTDSAMKKVMSPNTNPFLTEANAQRIVETLCRVRGAALKLGQMLSIQDEELVPSYLLQIFERVRQSADFMPTYQVHRQLEKELGKDWRARFREFSEMPFAAASIGQVHKGVALDGKEVAVKIQYPGVADSIDSDINNLMSVMNWGNIFPKGIFLDNFVSVARRELKAECDYVREAKAIDVFRRLLKDDPNYYAPAVYPDLSGKRILTTEYVRGKSVDACISEPQIVRDYIATKFIELCLNEIFVWRFMQTDPNWSNFMLGRHPETGESRLILLDFGASRSYKKNFVDHYMHIIRGSYEGDRDKVLKYSREIGFLTGYESKMMEKAHCDSTMIMGEVLTSREPFDFATQNVTRRIQKLIPVMLEHRLTSPPDEIYSLHRKLSGSYLIATKLKAIVSCGPLFDEIYRKYKFGADPEGDAAVDPIFRQE